MISVPSLSDLYEPFGAVCKDVVLFKEFLYVDMPEKARGLPTLTYIDSTPSDHG